MTAGLVTRTDGGVHSLTFERRFGAPPARVFAAWTDPGLMVGWWGPQGMHIPEIEIDLRVGGRWRTVMQNAEGGRHIVGGVYREIDAPRRLAMTWAWEHDGVPGHESLIEIEFEADGEGTLMRFAQTGFESQNAANMHSHGWQSSFVCLDEFIATGALRA